MSCIWDTGGPIHQYSCKPPCCTTFDRIQIPCKHKDHWTELCTQVISYSGAKGINSKQMHTYTARESFPSAGRSKPASATLVFSRRIPQNTEYVLTANDDRVSLFFKIRQITWEGRGREVWRTRLSGHCILRRDCPGWSLCSNRASNEYYTTDLPPSWQPRCPSLSYGPHHRTIPSLVCYSDSW